MNPRQIFNYFANKNLGQIGIEEFSEVCKYMGLNIPNSKKLQIFSRVDLDKSGELEFIEFLKALREIKMMIIFDSIETLGLTVNDLVTQFVMSISILLMTFVFIFISIQAFSTASTFSSVTNSLLPILAGGAVNKTTSKDNETQEDDLVQAVDDKIN